MNNKTIYVLSIICYDWYRFENVITASTDINKIIKAMDEYNKSQNTNHSLEVYNDETDKSEEMFDKGITHFRMIKVED